MSQHRISDEDILLYSCGELGPQRCAEVEAALGRDPARAALADQYRRALAAAAGAVGAPAGDEFNQDLRARLVEELPGVDALPARPRAGARRWLKKAAVGLAACLCIAGALVVLLIGGEEARAYVLADVPARLGELRSLYVKGFVYYAYRYSDPPQKRPYETYTERPHRTWWTFPAQPSIGYGVTDGHQYMRVDQTKRECVTGKDVPLHVRLGVEMHMVQWAQQYIGDLTVKATKLRSEQVGDVRTDVYERIVPERSGSKRYLIWFDPASGLPVQTKSFRTNQSGVERLTVQLDVIEADAPPPWDMFKFEPPQGFKIIRRDRTPEGMRMAGVVAGAGPGGILRIAFDIDDRAILLCWDMVSEKGRQDSGPKGDDPNGLGFDMVPMRPNATWPFDYHQLRIDRTEQHDWRWALLIPKSPQDTVSAQPFGFTFRVDKRTRLGMNMLKLPPQRLAEMIDQVQALTLAPNADPQDTISLERLRRIIDEYDSKRGDGYADAPGE